MCIGSGCLSNDVKNDIEISEKNVMKILGIYFGKNKKECETLNWKEKVQKNYTNTEFVETKTINSSRESSCD